MKFMNRFLYILSLLILLSACKKDDVVPAYDINVDKEYFPLKINSYLDYEVEKITWNDFDSSVDTTQYFLREITESIVENYSSDTLFRLERFIKSDIHSNWNDFPRIWYAGFKDNYFYKVEENVKYVKLVLPLVENAKWNGNAYNTEDYQAYKLIKLNTEESVGNFNFDKTLTVLQQEDESLISHDFEIEIYAKSIGLVYKEEIHLKKTYNNITQSFEISSGYKFKQTLIDYGNLP